MLIRLLRFLRGTVDFRVEGKYVERFLNLAARAKIPIWAGTREKHIFCGTTLLTNEDSLKQIAEKVQLQWNSDDQNGAPKIKMKYHKRRGIVAGFLILLIVMTLSQQFVWDIDVKGADTVSEDKVILAAQEQGLRPGVWKHQLDVIDIADKISLQFPEVSWAAVNLLGTVAEIEIVERVEPPELIDEDTPCNVVSTQSGRIIELEVYDGQRLVKVGDTVKEGELISAGILQDRHGRTIYRHARAKAVVEYTLDESISVPLRIDELASVGKTENSYYLILGKWNLPLSLSSISRSGQFSTEAGLIESGIYKNNNEEHWFYSVRNRRLSFFGVKLPITLQIRQYISAERVSIDRSVEKCKNLALLKLEESNRKLQNSGVQIIKTDLKGSIQENKFILTAKITCRKDAAKEVPIQFKENLSLSDTQID